MSDLTTLLELLHDRAHQHIRDRADDDIDIVLAAGIIAAAIVHHANSAHKDTLIMTQAFDNLTAAVTALEADAAAAVAVLQNPPAGGTPDSEIDPVTARVQAVSDSLKAAIPPPA